MKYLLLLALLVPSIASAHNIPRPHAHYGGRIYYGAVCSRARCSMCNNIRQQIRNYRYVPPQQYVAPPEPVEEAEPFDPSDDETVAHMLSLCDVQPEDVVFDLGCGNGKILKAAWLNYNAVGVGIEINPKTARLAERNVNGLPIKILTGDAAHYSYAKATVITMYLFPEVLEPMARQIKRTAKVGTRIVSFNHDIPGVQTQRVIVSDALTGDNYYFYLWTVSGNDQWPL